MGFECLNGVKGLVVCKTLCKQNRYNKQKPIFLDTAFYCELCRKILSSGLSV